MVFSDTESTRSSSEHSFGDVHAGLDPFMAERKLTYKFHAILDKILEGTANKTVLIPDTQMTEIKRGIAADYTKCLLHHSDSTRHGVELHLLCASHVMDQFWGAQEMILQTKMPSTTLETIFHTLENYVCPRIVDQLYPMGDLTTDVLGLAVTWICTLEDEMARVASYLELREEWGEERQCLLNHYLDRAVRHETMILLQEVLRLHSDDDIRQNEEGNLVTSFPETITHIFNQQLNVASQCLPSRFREDVVMACNGELGGMISEWKSRISSEGEEMSGAYFCAVINDTSRLAEYCEERHEEYLTRPELIEAANGFTRDIAGMSLHVTRCLCERMILNLCEPEPILNSIGNAVWESPEGHSAVDRTIATFKDFFAYCEQWLTARDYFLTKVLKSSFDLALKTYLESFFANTMVRGVDDPMVAAKELEQDYLRFVVYFNGEHFIEYHGCGGFYSQKTINDRLRILQSMAALIDPTNIPTNLSFEIQDVLAYFGDEKRGRSAVLHLVGLRRRQRGVRSIDWMTEIASAKKELAKRGERETLHLSCEIPDVRNSKTLPPRSAIPREIPHHSRPFAELTVRLLHHPGVFLPTAATVNILPTVATALTTPVRTHLQGPPCSGQEQHVDEKENAKENQTPENHYPVEESESSRVFYFEGRVLAEI